jgi:hypothetical protein
MVSTDSEFPIVAQTRRQIKTRPTTGVKSDETTELVGRYLRAASSQLYFPLRFTQERRLSSP